MYEYGQHRSSIKVMPEQLDGPSAISSRACATTSTCTISLALVLVSRCVLISRWFMTSRDFGFTFNQSQVASAILNICVPAEGGTTNQHYQGDLRCNFIFTLHYQRLRCFPRGMLPWRFSLPNSPHNLLKNLNFRKIW